MLNMTPVSSTAKNGAKKSGATDTTGFDMNLSSQGSMVVKLEGVYVTGVKTSRLGNDFNTLAQLQLSKDFSSGSFTEVVRTMIAKKAQQVQEVEVLATIQKAISLQSSDPAFFQTIRPLVKFLQQRPSLVQELLPLMPRIHEPHVAETLFYLFSAVSTPDAQLLLCKHGLLSAKREVKLQALMSASHVSAPSTDLFDTLFSLLASTDEQTSAHALYALTSCVRMTLDTRVRSQLKQILLNRLTAALKSNARTAVLSALLALKNAGGSSFVSYQEFPFHLISRKDVAASTVLDQIFPPSSQLLSCHASTNLT